MAIFVCMPNLSAQDWPQFLGPNYDGTSNQKGLLRTWPASGPEIIWSVSVESGFGGPVVKDGKVYLLDRNDETGDIMRCFDLETGTELWKYAYNAPGSVMYPGSRSVPIVDDKHVYSVGHNGDLYCIDINTRKPVWNKNVWSDFGGTTLPIWAISQSPIIYGNLLIVSPQAPEAGVIAYNKLTGEIAWKTKYFGNESYSSPTVIKIHGEDHVVIVSSSTNTFGHSELSPTSGTIAGINPLTGEILWEYNNWLCHISVPNAITVGDNKIAVLGGYENGVVMLRIDKKNDGSFGVTELFTHNNFGDQTKPPIVYNGYLYAQFTTNSKRDGLVCMNMEGEVMWKTSRNPLFDKGSMILADGLIIATDGRKSLYLIEPDPTGFKPLAQAEIFGTGTNTNDNQESGGFSMSTSNQNWAPIALADGKLLVRDHNKMLCLKMIK